MSATSMEDLTLLTFLLSGSYYLSYERMGILADEEMEVFKALCSSQRQMI